MALMQNYFNELLNSYSKLKKRELKFKVNIHEAQTNELTPEVLAKEGALIQLISSLAPGGRLDVPGIDKNGEKKSVTIARYYADNGTQVAKSVGAYNPAGSRAVYGNFIGGTFNPSNKPTSRNPWGKLLIFYARNKTNKEGEAEKEEELQNISIADAFVTPKLLSALGTLKTTFGDMWEKGLFSWVLKDKYKEGENPGWNGKTRARIESNIYSKVPGSLEQKSLSYKIQQSIGYMLQPVEGTDDLALVQTPIIDPELVADCVERFDFITKTAQKFLHPDTTDEVQKEDLVTIQNLISFDRNTGIILARAEGAGEAILFPTRASKLWEDFVDNYNIALAEKGLGDYSIKEQKLEREKNLNNVRGTGTEKILSILSLIKNKNLPEASLSMQEMYGTYGMALFEAFSVLEVYKDDGLIDADDTDLVALTEDLEKLFDLQDCSHEVYSDQYRKTPCIQKNVFKAFKGIVTEFAKAYRDVLFVMNPDAITHVGGKVGVGKKADNRLHYKTAEEAKTALKRMGVSKADIALFQLFDREKGKTFSDDEMVKYRADPEETTNYVNLSVKNYIDEGPTNMGESSTQNIVGLLSEEKLPEKLAPFIDYLYGGIGLSPEERKSTTKIAKDLEKSMSLFKGTLENKDHGPETRRTIISFIENNIGGYEDSIRHEVLDLLKKLKFDDPAQVSYSLMQIKKAVFHAQLSKKLKTNRKNATNFVMMMMGLTSCAFGETVTSMKFLKDRSSLAILNNKTMFDIAKKVRDGTYRLGISSDNKSFRVYDPERPFENVVALKSDRRKRVNTTKDKDFMDYFATWQVRLGHKEAKNNSLKPKTEVDENSKLVKDYMEAQTKLFEQIFANLN